VNRAGFSGGDLVQMPRRQGGCLQLSVTARFCFRGRHVADRLEQAAVVEPGDPRKGGELDRLHAAPGPAPPDDLGLEQAVDRPGKRMVAAVADAADRRLDPGLEQTLGAADRQVLGAADALLFVKPRSAVG
jgi:hypothetical protein